MSEVVVQGLTMDSRQVKPGDLFMAVPGLMVDGRDYIQEAIDKGAVAVLMEGERGSEKKGRGVPIITIPHLKELMGPIASRFYAEPSKQLPVIGVTGTNGKTSTTHFIANILSLCDQTCGVIGTLGLGFLGHLDENYCTTPDAISLQKALAAFKAQPTKAVAMEVTSHALVQSRVNGIQFHTAVLTNLTRDHLDYHIDMQQYAAAKQKLFLECNPLYSVINMDDPFGVELFKKIKDQNKIIGFTIENNITKNMTKMMTTQKLSLTKDGIQAWIKTPWGEGEVLSPLLGKFNFSNLLAAIATVCLQGIPFAQVLKVIPFLNPVNGRMMRYGGINGLPLVVVDYAHTPDALSQVLTSIRAHCEGKLWCVFGCGGDRDRGKRGLMGKVVETLSDQVCITQDNSRTEDPSHIISDILSGLSNPLKATLLLDRREAIQSVIEAAGSKDCVVIAGKGHETYQIVGTKRVPFSDKLEVEYALKARREACQR